MRPPVPDVGHSMGLDAVLEELEYTMPIGSISARRPFAAVFGDGRFAVDALIALVLVMVTVFAMVALLGLLNGADTNAAAIAVGNEPAVILPP